MLVKVRTIDGKLEEVLEISKRMTINEFRVLISKEFSIEQSDFRLFYRGKQLEDGHRVCDYNLNHHEVVQLFKVQRNPSPKPRNDLVSRKQETKDAEGGEVELKESESPLYKVGDQIDCIDQSFGAWFEARIIKILSNNVFLIYRVQWEFLSDKEPFDVEEDFIRPRARKLLSVDQIKIGEKVMVNLNIEHPEKDGYWYDLEVSKVKKRKADVELIGTLHIGRGDGATTVDKCKLNPRNEIYKIEEPVPVKDRNESTNLADEIKNKPRRVVINCEICNDDERKKCKDCGCCICGEKKHPEQIILCDECDKAFHMKCLSPPLDLVPEEDWYCPQCKTDDNQIVKAGEMLKPSKKQIKVDLKKGQKDWGKGMGCMGRLKDCTLVPLNHKGAIPGIEVGMSWKYRLQVSEAGVHRPHVAGIHGRESECAYSIVLSGGYEDDVDNGEEFIYTGSGGRDLSGNKRTAAQSSDQTLTKMNKALALNCNAEFNDVDGATAEDWKKGIPIRVVRAAKLKKHNKNDKYAPDEGFRYDGIYKVVKYFCEKGKSGFNVWRYILRRDDEIPAPWTREGKDRIKQLGLKMFDYDIKKESSEKAKGLKQQQLKFKRKSDNSPERSSKVPKIEYKLEEDVKKLIKKDKVNKKLWDECCSYVSEGKIKFISTVMDRFTCVCCQELVFKPVTTRCLHNICDNCLKNSFNAEVFSCPTCRHPLDKNKSLKVNENLVEILKNLFPGYTNGR